MIRLGCARADITPDQPVDLCGYALRNGASTGLHDPLSIRWIALQVSDEEQVLLGSADLISFSRTAYQSLKDRICADAKTTCNVALATTHTHSAPVTVRLRYCGKVNKAYLAKTKSTIVEAAGKAMNQELKPVQVTIGSGICDVNFNRRHRETGMPADKEVITVAFVDESGTPLATLINYACHPVVLGHLSNSVSGDYAGYLTRFVEHHTGSSCLFLNGACGDVNPVNEHSTDAREAAKTGEAIGRVALEAIKSATLVTEASPGWHRVQIDLPVKVPTSAQDFQKRLEMLEEKFGISASMFSDRVERDSRLLAEGKYPRTVGLELSMLTIGDDAAIVFVPGELFTSIGLQMKKMAAPRKLIISGFSNGSIGYLPDRQAYQDGGYEPLYANFFYDFPEFDPSLEDALLDGFQRLLKKARTPSPAM